jgi:hypothetical protein
VYISKQRSRTTINPRGRRKIKLFGKTVVELNTIEENISQD